MRVTFWGVRGSAPVPGPGTVRYGGNTPCVEVAGASGRIFLDAGTGLLAAARAGADDPPGETTILLSHTHWDHIQGLTLHPALYREGGTLRLLGPSQGRVPLRATIERLLAPEYFPVGPEALVGRLEVVEVTGGSFEVNGFAVEAVRVRHGVVTLGYRLLETGSGKSLIFITDNELGDWSDTDLSAWREGMVRFVRGGDLLVHDAMWRESDWPARRGWGHSTARQAIAMARAAGVGTLVLFHHDPAHDDDAMDRFVAEAERDAAEAGFELVPAREGLAITLG
ncbi:MAG TPA: MBL fold metallo-hydrolase [Gemmatimonadales bacterium]|nr:MBL fold metallo-hydrolase [Gemmatimonadales bacterium]